MTTTRSPRFPYIALDDAVGKVKKIYGKHGRDPVAPEVAVGDMGYKSLNGSSQKVLAAMKNFGLLEDQGDTLRVTPDGQSIAIELEDSQEYAEAIRRSIQGPDIFSDLVEAGFHKDSDGRNIAVYLQKRGFKPDGSQRAAQNFLSSVALVNDFKRDYDESHVQDEVEGAEDSVGAIIQPAPSPSMFSQPAETSTAVAVKPMEGERELTTGLLSKEAGFRLFVSGKVGPKELDRLIKKLQLDRDILSDPDETDEPGE